LLDEQFIQAYRATDYRVHAKEPFSLRTGETCAASDAILDAHGVTTAAYLTTWNPYSEALSNAENSVAQSKLDAELVEVSVVVLSGEGVGAMPDCHGRKRMTI